jgi:hypothetical protein
MIVVTGVQLIVGVVTVLVRLNEVLADPAVTVTLYGPPPVALAVKVPGSATPEPLAETLIVFVVLEKVPLAPEPGAVKTTEG